MLSTWTILHFILRTFIIYTYSKSKAFLSLIILCLNLKDMHNPIFAFQNPYETQETVWETFFSRLRFNHFPFSFFSFFDKNDWYLTETKCGKNKIKISHEENYSKPGIICSMEASILNSATRSRKQNLVSMTEWWTWSHLFFTLVIPQHSSSSLKPSVKIFSLNVYLYPWQLNGQVRFMPRVNYTES